MDKKTEKLLKSLKSQKVGVFCDDSNLYHAYKKYGWRIDFEKFRKIFVSYEENMAWELRKCWHFYLNGIKDEIGL